MEANLDKNFENKKLIAKLFFELSEPKKVSFENLYDDSENIYELWINSKSDDLQILVDIDSTYEYILIPNFIDDCLESTEIIPSFFEINEIKSVFVGEDEVFLTKEQIIKLIDLLEIAVKYEFGIFKQKRISKLTDDEKGCDLYHQLKDEAVC